MSLSKESQYLHREEREGPPPRLAHGGRGKLKEVPFHGRLVKRGAPEGDLDGGLTTDLAETVPAPGAEASREVRWQGEELPRGSKHLTGSEKCPRRAARAQRNHFACCYPAWLSLKVKAKELGQTL